MAAAAPKPTNAILRAIILLPLWFLIIFIGFVFCFVCLFLLATAKGWVADGTPIPSCRPSVVDFFGLHFLWPLPSSENPRFQTTLHALRF